MNSFQVWNFSKGTQIVVKENCNFPSYNKMNNYIAALMAVTSSLESCI